LWSGENGEERTEVSEVKSEAVKWRNDLEGKGASLTGHQLLKPIFWHMCQ
jgi:hypothetical protein